MVLYIDSNEQLLNHCSGFILILAELPYISSYTTQGKENKQIVSVAISAASPQPQHSPVSFSKPACTLNDPLMLHYKSLHYLT